MQLSRVIAGPLIASLLCGCGFSRQTQTASVSQASAPATMRIEISADVVAGACQSAQASFQDGGGGTFRLSSSTEITLSGGKGLSFFSDSACSAQITDLTATAGAENVSFYFAATVSGSASVQASAGLQAGAPTARASAAVSVAPGPATTLAFSSGGPTVGVAGISLIPALALSALDAFGNLATTNTGSVSIAAFTDSGCTSSGSGTLSNASVTLSAGQASLPALQYTQSGPIYLAASLGSSVRSPCSQPIMIAPGAATSLVFKSYPSASVTAGTAVAAIVAVHDALGNLATGASGLVTLSTAAGNLTSQAPSGGLATFSVSTLTQAGAYQLTAVSTGLTPVTGTAFNIVAGAASAATSSLTVSAPAVPVGGTIAISATIQDAFHNPIVGVPVSFARSSTAVATLTEPATTTNQTGSASGSISSGVFGTQNLSIQSPSGLGGLTAQATFTDASLTLPSAPLDYGPVNEGMSLDQVIQVTYLGNVAASVAGGAATIVAASGGNFVFKGGSYPGTGGSCGAQIQTNCTLVVTFAPVVTGLSGATLSLSYTPTGQAAAKSTALTVMGRSMTGVAQLSWGAYPGEQNGFLLEHSNDNVTFTQIQQLPATASSATVTGLSTGQTHFFRIRSFNGAGDSAYSTTVSAAIP